MSPELTLIQLLDVALALNSSVRRAALLLLAIDGALNGGRRAEPEDGEAIRGAVQALNNGARRR